MCDCKYKSTGVTIMGLGMKPELCSCPLNNATTKQCGCCVSTQQYKDWVTPSCRPSDPLATCSCSNVTVTVKKITTTTQVCNCLADLKSQLGTVNVVKIPVNTTRSCGSYNEGNKTVYMCCLKEDDLTRTAPMSCNPALQVNASCSCPMPNGNVRNCSCSLRDGKTTYFVNPVAVNSNDCSCYNVTANGVTKQQCNCCAPKSLTNFTQVVKAPTCNATTASSQNCDCKRVWDSETFAYVNLCNCTSKVGKVDMTRVNVNINPAQCSCMNKTVDGKENSLQCACCVPNPPPTMCQSLALTNSSILNCRCQDVVIGGKAQFSCNCSAQVNSTKVLYQNQMLLNEDTCCCIEKSDFQTGMGYKACNCTQPAALVKQQCSCTPVNGKSDVVNCVCSDCNFVKTQQSLSPNSCQCSGMLFDQSGFQVKSEKSENQANSTSLNGTSVNGTNSSSGKANSTTGANATTNGTVNTNTTSGNATKPQNGTNATANSTSSSTNGTKTNSTGNATTNATVNGSASTNSTKSNSTSGNTTAGNATAGNATTNGTKTNATGSNATATNGTKTNGTSATNSTNGSASSNTTKSNSTSGNATTGNATTNGTKTNTTSANNTGSSNTT